MIKYNGEVHDKINTTQNVLTPQVPSLDWLFDPSPKIVNNGVRSTSQ